MRSVLYAGFQQQRCARYCSAARLRLDAEPCEWITLEQFGWNKAPLFSPSDYYVVASSQVNSKGTSQTGVAFMDDSLAQFLFTSSGLDIPLDMFVSPVGPMQSQFQHMDVATTINNLLGFEPSQVCHARDIATGRGDGVAGSGPQPPTNLATTTILQIPASTVLGEDFTIHATVTAGTGPMTAGSMIFLQDQSQIANVPLDANGAASFTVSNLPLGTHSFQALYSRAPNYEASESAVAMVNVYADTADLSVSLSAPSLAVSYGTTSSAIAVQANPAQEWQER